MHISGEPKLSGTEQMAAYGLWFLGGGFDELGPSQAADFDEMGINPHGFSKILIADHHSECLLLAYQSLSFINCILLGSAPANAANTVAEKYDFSAIGKLGAEKRHKGMRELSRWTIEYVCGGRGARQRYWPSIVA